MLSFYSFYHSLRTFSSGSFSDFSAGSGNFFVHSSITRGQSALVTPRQHTFWKHKLGSAYY